MSNIVKVFNPPESRDLEPKEYENCLPCQIMATVTAIGAGIWFTSGQLFDDSKLSKTENLKKNPIWWRYFIRGSGYGLIGYGVFRGTEGWLWNDKPVNDEKRI
ncbi:hypothetical protein WICANDRAFT_62972 [Wickerhamomyces anomalus NRRL Y-366-8]|uniref:DUF4536 domain-containing protein n=1 Tax=Wickerhamomyces anomalus (strain ATCC 58044 / CBS 1984 / NCYC 433 / NRRL Y-366-8) TaxID=683960 RepID=A0A1E3P4Y6_WICAA|nr:uncharacterized protein WICANDRAFT_62972 [Wickerhamomyces anomalus NRRL Y-366-8]ODQ60413.1 hypothetical protein WICANDRAFT_62972 [Wickerhamomyces anomalus NRRL Y-366-8]